MADKKQSKKKTEQEKNWYGPVPGISIEAQGPLFLFRAFWLHWPQCALSCRIFLSIL